MNGAAERLTGTIELAKRFPKARIVFSGGSGNLIQNGLPEAPIAGDWLQRFGIAADRITLESGSRTTDENAVFTRRMLMPKPGERWLLLTSAFHMPRSIGAFRAAGFDVEAYPVDWRTRGWVDAGVPFDMLSSGLARTDAALHEWIGLVSYSVYLVHYLLLQLIAPGPLGAPVYLAVLFAVCWATHRYVELPGQRLVRAAAARPSPAATRSPP